MLQGGRTKKLTSPDTSVEDMNNRQATTMSFMQENITKGPEKIVNEKGIYCGVASE